MLCYMASPPPPSAVLALASLQKGTENQIQIQAQL